MARALEAGASDYIIKPFSPTELAARIKAALQSSTPRAGTAAAPQSNVPASQQHFELGDMSIDHAARLVHVSGHPIDLAPVEYRILTELAANAGTLLTHNQLISAVWGTDTNRGPNRLRTVIKDLRQKPGDDARNPRHIFTAPRVGYRMPKPS